MTVPSGCCLSDWGSKENTVSSFTFFLRDHGTLKSKSVVIEKNLILSIEIVQPIYSR